MKSPRQLFSDKQRALFSPKKPETSLKSMLNGRDKTPRIVNSKTPLKQSKHQKVNANKSPEVSSRLRQILSGKPSNYIQNCAS